MNKGDIPFDGDTIDRERVRDVLLEKKYFNYEWRNHDERARRRAQSKLACY